ncbi:MAG: HIT domain-containing protein [Gaiellaceae bacterium]
MGRPVRRRLSEAAGAAARLHLRGLARPPCLGTHAAHAGGGRGVLARGAPRREGDRAAHDPAKLNLQILGNAVPHLHTHVVPRYLDDPEPERPPAFASAETEELAPDRYDAEVEALTTAIAEAR